MEWIGLISPKRTGKKGLSHENKFARTEFERDWDRIIFSNAFRRMQNKTQVFPLPGRHLVHNRLTHSLEVASVGRSLGKIVGNELENKNKDEWSKNKISSTDFAQIVSSACLAHDIGNPPFGHSGEDAISHYYNQYEDGISGLERNKDAHADLHEWSDLDKFEGNANGFRILVNNNPGLIEGGFRLTYSTLATIMKYPRNSLAKRKVSIASEKKFGYFRSEEFQYDEIASYLRILKKKDGRGYVRHPLTFLMEAADDICNLLLDIEDACKLKIITEKEFTDLTYALIKDDFENKLYDINIYNSISKNDVNEKLSYLRARAINTLIYKVKEVFINNERQILNGEFDKPLIEEIPKELKDIITQIEKLKKTRIYTNRSVLEIEAAGFEVLGGLIDIFITEVLLSKPKSKYSKKLKLLLPKQYLKEEDDSYNKLMKINDFVSGMTDDYAIDLYRKIKGISLPTNY